MYGLWCIKREFSLFFVVCVCVCLTDAVQPRSGAGETEDGVVQPLGPAEQRTGGPAGCREGEELA